MQPLVTMRKALADPDIFGTVLHGESWDAWRVLIIAAMGEPLINDAEREIFTRLTGRTHEPLERVDEFWAIIGRRGGKSRAAGIIAAYIASLVDYRDVLAPGETASLPILSASLWASKRVFQFLNGIFSTVPALRKLVINQTADTISLSTRVDIECRPASYRVGARSATCCAVICDEISSWMDEASGSANPDSFILQSIRPCLLTTNGPLVCISTPFARRGELFETFKRDFGADGDPLVLVAKSDSLTMHPSLSPKIIQRAWDRDPISAASEYGRDGDIVFRSDVEAFVSHEVVDACTIQGRYELPPLQRYVYHAFCDPSGRSGGDDMTLAIAHKEGDIAVLDCIRVAHPPFNPDDVVKTFSDTIKSYHAMSVHGDKYGGDWPSQRFNAHSISYIASDHTKSEIYIQFLPLLMGSRCELLDNNRLHSQLVSLEARTARGGRLTVDHCIGHNHHDDISNACAGALTTAAGWSGEFCLETWMAAWA